VECLVFKDISGIGYTAAFEVVMATAAGRIDSGDGGRIEELRVTSVSSGRCHGVARNAGCNRCAGFVDQSCTVPERRNCRPRVGLAGMTGDIAALNDPATTGYCWRMGKITSPAAKGHGRRRVVPVTGSSYISYRQVTVTALYRVCQDAGGEVVGMGADPDSSGRCICRGVCTAADTRCNLRRSICCEGKRFRTVTFLALADRGCCAPDRCALAVTEKIAAGYGQVLSTADNNGSFAANVGLGCIEVNVRAAAQMLRRVRSELVAELRIN